MSLTLVHESPFTKQVWIGDGGAYLQVEAGHYPNGMNERRLETYGRRVYADEGGAAVVRLLEDLAVLESGKITLPVWERGAQIEGAR